MNLIYIFVLRRLENRVMHGNHYFFRACFLNSEDKPPVANELTFSEGNKVRSEKSMNPPQRK